MSNENEPFSKLINLGSDDSAEDTFSTLFSDISEEEEDENNPFAPKDNEEDTDDEAPEESVTDMVADSAPEETAKTTSTKNGHELIAPDEIHAPSLVPEMDSAQESESEPQNILMEAIETQDRTTLSAKMPIFKYGSAEEEIEDVGQTFDELRVAKAGDFPELEDANRVTWIITYGKISKSVAGSDAKKKKIGDFKKSIETSKEFMDALKKSKDKKPVCEIKPRVTAQSKGEGISAYKGVFRNMNEAENSGKLICIVPGSDGKVYEIRNEEMGRFITPAGTTEGLSEITAGFIPALPLIPNHQLQQIISFFRSFLTTAGNYEAIANIFWDREEQVFVTSIPKQSVERVRADSILSAFTDTNRYLHYMDIHSHNVMNAKFSAIDNIDEKATRLYGVVGCLNSYFPRIKVRLSNGGKYKEIDPALVLEPYWEDYPDEWDEQVTVVEKTLKWGAQYEVLD